MPSIQENLGWALESAWKDHGEEWSSGFGNSHFMWHGFILPRIARHLPCERGLEIACGHGRCTRYLATQCEKLWAVDLTQEVVDVCRGRLSAFRNIEYAKTDGMSLPMVADASVDFAFSWDSLVHAEEDVLAGYAKDLGRVLKPGGFGFLHHSNLGAFRGASGEITVEHKHWRAESMTAEKFRAACVASGLVCITQELVPWGGAQAIDCLSYFTRPLTPMKQDPLVIENTGFQAEAANLMRLSKAYAWPRATP